jgi:hypothetical protein
MKDAFLERAFWLNQRVPVFAKHVPVEICDFVPLLPLELARPIAEAVDTDPSRDNQADAMLDLMTWHAIARWAFVGMPTFQLTHGAAAAFALTDPSSVLYTDFRTPFPTFIVSMPVPFLTTIGGDDIHSICWHELDQRPPDSNEARPAIYVRGFGEGPTYSSLFAYILTPSSRITTSATLGDMLDAEHLSMRSTTTLDSEVTRFVRVISQMMMSFALYVTTHGPGQPLSRRARTMNSGVSVPASPAPIREPSIWLTGREIKIDRALREAAAAFGDAERDPTQWKLRARFTVRGHWRNQACGPGHTEHRMRWIAPYWKGPADGVGIQHMYTTDESS